jgi:hypothetical protein
VIGREDGGRQRSLGRNLTAICLTGSYTHNKSPILTSTSSTARLKPHLLPINRTQTMQPTPSHLLAIPRELRNIIYHHYFPGPEDGLEGRRNVYNLRLSCSLIQAELEEEFLRHIDTKHSDMLWWVGTHNAPSSGPGRLTECMKVLRVSQNRRVEPGRAFLLHNFADTPLILGS